MIRPLTLFALSVLPVVAASAAEGPSSSPDDDLSKTEEGPATVSRELALRRPPRRHDGAARRALGLAGAGLTVQSVGVVGSGLFPLYGVASRGNPSATLPASYALTAWNGLGLGLTASGLEQAHRLARARGVEGRRDALVAGHVLSSLGVAGHLAASLSGDPALLDPQANPYAGDGAWFDGGVWLGGSTVGAAFGIGGMIAYAVDVSRLGSALAGTTSVAFQGEGYDVELTPYADPFAGTMGLTGTF